MQRQLGSSNGSSSARRMATIIIIIFFNAGISIAFRASSFAFFSNLISDASSSLSSSIKKNVVSTNTRVSVTMTTCNRHRLTKDSLRTFYQYNSNDGIRIVSFKIVVDCYNATFAEAISHEFPRVELIYSTSNRTAPTHRVLDNVQLLFTHVLRDRTKYWVHLEDDWNFVASKFISDGIRVLEFVAGNEEEDHFNSSDDGGGGSNIWQVMGREANTFRPMVNATYGWRNIAAHGNITFGVLNNLSGGGGSFGSFTLNDSVMRVSSARHWIGDFSKFNHEAEVSKMIGTKYDARVAILKEHRYYHTGVSGLSTMTGGNYNISLLSS